MNAARAKLFARSALQQAKLQIRLSSHGKNPYTYNVRGYVSSLLILIFYSNSKF